jgi:nitrite reductase/ring-hydroxylating ferredoxin subunit
VIDKRDELQCEPRVGDRIVLEVNVETHIVKGVADDLYAADGRCCHAVADTDQGGVA